MSPATTVTSGEEVYPVPPSVTDNPVISPLVIVAAAVVVPPPSDGEMIICGAFVNPVNELS